jgi:hypothetical protein
MLDQVDAVARRLQTVEPGGSVRALVEKAAGLELLEGSGGEQPELPGAAEG